MNQDEWHDGLKKWLAENAITDDEGKTWSCKDCGEALMGREKTASLHIKEMRLAGSGETVTLKEPYCPKCGKCYSVPPFLDHGGKRDYF